MFDNIEEIEVMVYDLDFPKQKPEMGKLIIAKGNLYELHMGDYWKFQYKTMEKLLNEHSFFAVKKKKYNSIQKLIIKLFNI
jgi:phage pi2 protein 07